MMNWNLNLPLYLMLYLEKSNNSKTCPTVPARIVQISNVLKSSGSILGAATPDSAHFYCGAGGGGACACAGAGGAPVFTRSFNSLLGLKNGIFFAGTSTRSPVLGLRPTRGLRCRVRKLPKPRISILSPTRSERTMLSKIVSTITSLSLRVNSASRETSSIRSAFVIRLFAPQFLFSKTGLGSAILQRNSHNLLKFQGFLASGFSGVREYPASGLFFANFAGSQRPQR